MDQRSSSAEDQTSQDFQQSWKAGDEVGYLPEAAPQHSAQPLEALEHPGVERAAPPFPPGSAAYPGQFALESLLNGLTAAGHVLESADRMTILPVALHEFLRLVGGERGVALTCSDAPAPYRVVVWRNISEELADLFVQHPSVLETPPGVLVLIPPIQAAPEDTATTFPGGHFEQRLARAGTRWYSVLPLLVQGRVGAVLVALGQHELAPAVEQQLISGALVLLGELASAALERSQLRHWRAQEEHARTEFIGLASHELKSPLAVIKGYSQLLLRQAQREGDEKRIDVSGLEAINQQVNRMSYLVGQLLDVSRIERGVLDIQPQPVELVGLVQRVLEHRQRALVETSPHLIARVPVLMVLADPLRVEQVLGYLLDNAVRFGQEGKPVEVVVERATASQGASSGDMALVSVHDYGLGLPIEEQDRLFTAFYRGPENSLHRQRAGLGLGLYLSHYLITRQNGQLWAEFSVGALPGGSIFHLSLPLLPPTW